MPTWLHHKFENRNSQQPWHAKQRAPANVAHFSINSIWFGFIPPHANSCGNIRFWHVKCLLRFYLIFEDVLFWGFPSYSTHTPYVRRTFFMLLALFTYDANFLKGGRRHGRHTSPSLHLLRAPMSARRHRHQVKRWTVFNLSSDRSKMRFLLFMHPIAGHIPPSAVYAERMVRCYRVNIKHTTPPVMVNRFRYLCVLPLRGAGNVAYKYIWRMGGTCSMGSRRFDPNLIFATFDTKYKH